MRRDSYIGIALMLLCTFLYFQSTKIPHSPLVPVGAAFYPRIILILLFLMGLILMLSDISGTCKKRIERGGKLITGSFSPFTKFQYVIWTFLIVGLYIFSISFLGFYLSTTFFIAGLQWYLSARIIRRLPKYLAISIITTLLIYIVFEKYLHIFFPRGYLF